MLRANLPQPVSAHIILYNSSLAKFVTIGDFPSADLQMGARCLPIIFFKNVAA